MALDTKQWFPDVPVNARGPLLVCFPHSGAGATAYRQWTARLEPVATVVPVLLPGREQRIAEPPLTSVADVVAAVTGPALELLRPPFVLFGHSMGALLAFELAHALAEHGSPPDRLIVSGFPAPQVGVAGPPMACRSDAEIADHLRLLDGTDSALLDEPELLDMILPIVRADFSICENYRFPERMPLAIPITVLAGRNDDTVPPGSLDQWAATTTGPTDVVTFAGGHFYLNEQLGPVLDIVRSRLAAVAG